MSYNILNLPEYIQDNWGSGEISHRYSYLADGTKTSVGDYENSGYQYAGSLVYSMDYGTVNSFESASFGGGRIVGTNDGTSSEVHYFLTDHLGSTRVVAKVTPTGREDLDRKDYYPFGKEWAQPDMRHRIIATPSPVRKNNICDSKRSIMPISVHGSTIPKG